MRVVLLGSNPPERPGEASAAALESLAGALRRRGIDVGIVLPSDAVPDGAALLAALRRPGGWPALARHRRALRRAVEAEAAAGADLVHAHSWFPAGAAVPAGVPFVLTTYGSDVTLLRRSGIARRFAEPVFARATALTAASREAGDAVQIFTGRHVARTHVQPMPVDTARWPWTSGGGGAMVVSDLVPARRLELAISTVAVLASCGYALPLTIIGDGPLREELSRAAAREGVDTLVRFASAADPEEIVRRLATADLLLHPSKGDPSAPWVLAAVLLGVPVVACWDGGAVVEVVPESGAGRLALPSTEALSDAALGLLMDADRFEFARLVGEGWRARTSAEQAAEHAEGWYRETLGLRGAGG